MNYPVRELFVHRSSGCHIDPVEDRSVLCFIRDAAWIE